jgi:hypothetical protein
MVGEAGGSLGLTENKRFLPSLHDDRQLAKNNLRHYMDEKLSPTIRKKDRKLLTIASSSGSLFTVAEDVSCRDCSLLGFGLVLRACVIVLCFFCSLTF